MESKLYIVVAMIATITYITLMIVASIERDGDEEEKVWLFKSVFYRPVMMLAVQCAFIDIWCWLSR